MSDRRDRIAARLRTLLFATWIATLAYAIISVSYITEDIWQWPQQVARLLAR